MTDAGEPYAAPQPPFRVEVDAGGAVTRVSVSGEIDLSTVDAIDHEIAAAREQPALTHLLVDLRETTFMDSTGLRLLLSLLAHSQEHGYRLTVVRPPPEVHRAIEIAGLDQVLHLVDDPADVAPD